MQKLTDVLPIQQTALVPINRTSQSRLLWDYTLPVQHGFDASLTTLLLAIQKLKGEPKKHTNKANFETYCTLMHVGIATMNNGR